MRVQNAKKIHFDSGPNMTPLVDVVMVILIFLMLAGTFTGAEQLIVSTMPIVAKGAAQEESFGVPLPPLQVFVDSYGSGYTAYPAGLPRVDNRAALRGELVQARQQLNQSALSSSGAMIDSTTQIVINPDQTVKWQFLIDVYQAALEAGFTKVGFATAR
jgi:biopolymer transport protein ExbD